MTADVTARTTPAAGLRQLAVAPAAEALALGLIALVVYWITGPEGQGDMWPPLADAFLNGRLHLIEDRPWLELVPRPEGGQYVPLPPAPALTLLPAVLVMGPQPWFSELPSNAYTSVVGALNVGLAYWMLLGLGVAASSRRWITFGFAGTTHWWVAGMAGPHHYAETCGVFFSLLALNLAVRGRAPLASGLLLGLAAASRLPMGLAAPALAVLYAGHPWRPRSAHGWLLLGIAIPALAVAAYNQARFGSPFDFGYAHIPHGEEGLLITDEPWFSEGLMSVSYIPRHLNVMFVETFQVVDTTPYLRPSWTGAALWLTAPMYLLAAVPIIARNRLALVVGATVLLVLLPDLMWGSWGFAQFGYRRILDAAPLLLVLLGLGFRERIDWSARVVVLIGVVVHAYGIYVINVLGFVA
jgi:hypothetical protein